MRIVLAPMEGVVDHDLRALLTRIGGIDRCVTEFVRVTDALLPARVFRRICPELDSGSRTPSGTPVYLQLLGGRVEPLALNAQRAAELGAAGIDLNFGCPAKLVNRHDGGAVLLREPERIHAIVAACRAAVPAGVPVTAKIRLGFTDSSALADVCRAVVEAGASEIAIHARTREDGYRPPARWEALAPVASCSPIPVVANGEIWSPADAARCRARSGCTDLMLGRGLLACPDLALRVRGRLAGEPCEPLNWLAVAGHLLQFADVSAVRQQGRYVGNRVKQWLAYLRREYPGAGVLFERVKRLREPAEIRAAIEAHRGEIAARTAA